MSDHPAMELKTALCLAQEWVGLLRPSCERIEIAGSIRRRKPQVHDIELVAIPKYEQGEAIDLFGTTAQVNKLDEILNSLHEQMKFTYKFSPSDRSANGEKYKKLFTPEGIQIDLFIVTPPAQWGVLFTIRTGSDDFSHWLVTKRKYGGAMPSDCESKNGAIWRNGKIVPTPEEKDLFDLCGVWYEPSERGKDFIKEKWIK
jgi:DNA polymerase/3'-5' exonuclease PolX